MVSGGGTTITLAWDAPLEPGPDPILGYEISWIGYLHPMDPGNYYNSFQNPWSVVVPASARQFQVTDLTPGYNWQFVIQAFTATRIGSMTTGPLYIHEPSRFLCLVSELCRVS